MTVLLLGYSLNTLCVTAIEDGLAERGTHQRHLCDRHAALIATALSAAQEALGNYAEDGAGDLVRFHPHLKQSGDRAAGRGGVKRADQTVTRQCRLKRQRCGGGIADSPSASTCGSCRKMLRSARSYVRSPNGLTSICVT